MTSRKRGALKNQRIRSQPSNQHSSTYVLEHEDEFKRLEDQSKIRGYEIETELKNIALNAGDILLDAGCGSGVLSRIIALKNPLSVVIGCDSSEKRVDQAKAAARGILNLEIIKADLTRLGFQENFFDVIVCRFVLHHQSPRNGDRIVRELYRCLKPGGRIIAIDPDGMFHNLRPMPEVVQQALNMIRAKAPLDLFAGGNLPKLLLDIGFTNPTWRMEFMVESSEWLHEEHELMEQRLEQALPFLSEILESEEFAIKFRDEFLRALRAEGTIYYSPKVIASAFKTKTVRSAEGMD